MADTTPNEDTPQIEVTQLLSFSADDEGNAQTVMLLFGDGLAYNSAYGWLFYTDTHWSREGAEAKVNRAIVETLKTRGKAAFSTATAENGNSALIRASRLTASNRNACRDMFQDMVALKQGTDGAAQYDKHTHLLNCKNGAVDLRTGELIPHSPDQRFTYCLPYDYDPNANTAVWDAFLAGAVGDPAAIPFLQMAVGYSLTGATNEERLFYIFGPARSGKGTFTETVLELMGSPLARGIRFDMLTKDRGQDSNNADLATLKPCRYVTASESSRYTALNPSIIKSLTGGDSVYCAFKYGSHFEYRPQYKIWLTSNWPINTDVDDDAAWGRVYVIEFPHSHLGEEDKKLKERMKAPETLKGVLAWAVAGAVAWYASDKGLTPPESVTATAKRQREALDTVGQFMTECCKVDEGSATNAELWSAYQDWCNANGVTPKTQRGLAQTLKAKGYTNRAAWRTSRTVRVWENLTVNKVSL